MTLLRDGSFEIVGPTTFVPPPEVGNLAVCLRPGRGSWSAEQDVSGYWEIDLAFTAPVAETLSFQLTAEAPPYGFYQYFGDPDVGHVVGWKRVAGDEAAGPASLPAAPEPIPNPAHELEGEPPFPSVVGPVLLAFLVFAILVVLAAAALVLIEVAVIGVVLAVGATAAAALLASVVALVKRSFGAGARTFGGAMGAAGGLVAGAGAGWALDVLLHRPMPERYAALCGASAGLVAGTLLGWAVAYFGVRVLDAAIRRLRGVDAVRR
jgi:hypothetical protein